MVKIIHWLWGFPQNFFGFIISRFSKKKTKVILDGKEKTIYFMKFFNAGVSLGEFIILDYVYDNWLLETVAKHEYEHTKQSRMLGLFYLLIVGLPSVIRNIIDRFSKDTYKNRYIKYYSGYPEKWADKLGKVERFVKKKYEVFGNDYNGVYYTIGNKLFFLKTKIKYLTEYIELDLSEIECESVYCGESF